MSCCFGPTLVQPSAVAQDPTKHVNYALGMVLGVDDLNQEFAYHNQRHQWIVRDLIGYGTSWGLRVSIRDDGPQAVPEVLVSPGVAVSPRGQLIRVAPAQCAAINPWLAARTDEVVRHQIPTGSPNVFNLPLYVVLSYRDCLTDPVPIAGEPCRSETDSTKPSRAADDFLLELTFDPPPQTEEDAVRELVQWLRAHVTVTPGGSPSLSVPAFLDAIRAAAAAAEVSASPPLGPGEFLGETSPPTMLSVPEAQLAAYLGAAFRLWITELRPRWRPSWLGDECGCNGTGVVPAADASDRVLLAALTVPIVPPGLSQPGWTVTSAAAVVVSEERRPLLLHLRLLQEWLLTAASTGVGTGGALAPAVVAAGVINGNGSPTTRSVMGGLRVAATANTATATELRLTFTAYAQPPAVGGPQYLVKCLAWPATDLGNLVVTFARQQADGLVVRVSRNGAALAAGELNALQLMTEVSQLP